MWWAMACHPRAVEVHPSIPATPRLAWMAALGCKASWRSTHCAYRADALLATCRALGRRSTGHEDQQWIKVFNVNAYLTPTPVTITPWLAPVMNPSGKLRCPIISPYHNYSHPVIPLPVASSRRQQMMLFLSSGRQRLYLNLYNRSTSTNLAALAHCMRGGFQFSFRSSSPINSTVQSMTSRYSRTLTTPVC